VSLRPTRGGPEVTGGDDALVRVQRAAPERLEGLTGLPAPRPEQLGRAGTPLPNDLIQREDRRYLIVKVP